MENTGTHGQLKELVSQLMEKQREQMEYMSAQNAIDLSTTKDEIVKNTKAIQGEVEKLKTEIESVETEIKKKVFNESKFKSLPDTIYTHLKSDEYKEKVLNSRSGGKIDFAFSTKLPASNLPSVYNAVHQPTNFVDGDAPVVLPFREVGVDKAPVRPPMVSDLISWGTTNSNMIDWIERTNKVNAASMRAEDAAMAEGDLEYTEVSTKVKIASEYMKVTNEALSDVDFLSSEINTELLSDLKLLVDSQLLNGDGTGNNLKGINEYATPFAAGVFAASIVEPNEADVLRVAINKILVDGQMSWYPTAILMHPDDVAKLDFLKISDGRYIDVPFYDGEMQTVINVPIYINTGITQGEFLVGDFSKAKAFVRDQLTIRIFNQNEDDAIRNRSTVTANVRLAFRIKNQEAGAFVKGDFATAINDLRKP